MRVARVPCSGELPYNAMNDVVVVVVVLGMGIPVWVERAHLRVIDEISSTAARGSLADLGQASRCGAATLQVNVLINSARIVLEMASRPKLDGTSLLATRHLSDRRTVKSCLVDETWIVWGEACNEAVDFTKDIGEAQKAFAADKRSRTVLFGHARVSGALGLNEVFKVRCDFLDLFSSSAGVVTNYQSNFF